MFAFFTATYKLRQVLEYWLENVGTHIHPVNIKVQRKLFVNGIVCLIGEEYFFKLKKPFHSLLFGGFTGVFSSVVNILQSSEFLKRLWNSLLSNQR